MQTSDGWAVVFDFDGTLLPRKHVALAYLVAHRAFEDCPDVKSRLFSMYARYAEKSAKGQMTGQDEMDWLIQTNDAYVEGGLTEEKIAASLVDAVVRPGVRDCLEWLAMQGVPVGIVSFGFKPLIRFCLRNNGLSHLVDSVVAQEFRFDSSGSCRGWIPGTGVSPHGKGARSVAFAATHGIAPARILAVGDSEGDRLIGHLKKNRLGIAETAADAAKIAPHMSQVVITQDFAPVIGWLRRKIG
jgi:HAD superfamily phosphoserine phosphatase-like hydrolase